MCTTYKIILLTILLFIDCSKMKGVRINTRCHTKEKPYMMNSQFLQHLEVKTVQLGGQNAVSV